MSGSDSHAVTPDLFHPESVIRAPDGRLVQLKVHSANWDPDLPENSLAALAACLRAPVARAEIDLEMLADRDFVMYHDDMLDIGTTGAGPVATLTADAARTLRLRDYRHDDDLHEPAPATEHPLSLLSDVVELMQANPAPTLLQLDMKDTEPWPWPRVEELARLTAPVRSRVIFSSAADWNLRRLQAVDPTVSVGFDPMFYLDWAPEDVEPDDLPGVLGAYGYLDAHPLARHHRGPTVDYLRDRLGAVLRLVPGPRDLYIRLRTAERMVADGLDDLADIVHSLDATLDLWTLDAGTPDWEHRLRRAVEIGADVVTTNTPRRFAAVSL